MWARYVIQYTDIQDSNGTYPSMTLYDYAVAGGTCSNNITPHYAAPGVLFPSVTEYGIPTFISDSQINTYGTGAEFFSPPLSADNAVYAIWIGTNDLGNGEFLTGQQVAGKTLQDFVNCVFNAFDSLYNNGGRYFVLLNIVPLNLAPQYATAELGGVTADHYWPDKPSDLDAISATMENQVTTVNADYWNQLPGMVGSRYPGANFAILNVNQLARATPSTAPSSPAARLTVCCFSCSTSIITPNTTSTARRRAT